MSRHITRLIHDSWILFKRSVRIALRNPEALTQATITPFFLMFLFGNVFGNIVSVGDFNYIDFIIPGIILQSVAQASMYSAVNVSSDMTGGMIDRFRSMPIAKSTVLIGHAGASMVRNTITTVIIIGTAFLLGFRPQGDVVELLMAGGLLILIMAAISLIAVLCGLLAKTSEGAGGLMFPLFILPFISSGFAPTETMSRSVRWFAEIQPMSPIIDALRALLMGLPLGNTLWVALAWCMGIIVVTFVIAAQVYARKVS